MTYLRGVRTARIAGRPIRPIENARPPGPRSGPEHRRGERVNSRVPIAVEWDAGGALLRNEAKTCVVGPYGCMALLPAGLEVRQAIQLTNMVNQETNRGVVVWRGAQRDEGWELGIELINPQMGFWGLDQ